MSRARPYQTDLKLRAYQAWQSGARCIAIVLATGGGKTYVIGEIIKENAGGVAAIAHRQELVGQISLALAREGIRHDLLAPKATIRAIVAAHVQEFGRSFYDHHSQVKVGGIDTIIRMDASDPWFSSVTLVVIDEGHHVLRANKWGQGFAMFPNARGLFPTATLIRADGKGLGIKADGLVDEIIDGPCGRELIDDGYLTDYRIWCPTVTDINLTDADISDATGDFNKDKLRQAVHKSKQLVGDVVAHYLKIAPGKLGVTFAVDVEEATKIAAAFRAAGVPAEVVSAKTPDDMRRSILRKFKARQILQLVNVDLFGEGFDLPAIEVVSMARPTASFSLFAQQFGRALRVMVDAKYAANWDTYTADERKAIIAASSKPCAIIIDHVGNIVRPGLGLPDVRRAWSLDRRERKSRGSAPDAIPMRICLNAPTCIQPYLKIYASCPYCGTLAPAPAGRGSLEQVEGDLTELDPEVLRAMRGEVARVDGPPRIPSHLEGAAARAVWNNHTERQAAQRDLRHAIASWAAVHDDSDDATNHRRFWYTFGTDVLSASVLGARDAAALREKIAAKLAIDGYVISEYCPPTPPIAEQAA